MNLFFDLQAERNLLFSASHLKIVNFEDLFRRYVIIRKSYIKNYINLPNEMNCVLTRTLNHFELINHVKRDDLWHQISISLSAKKTRASESSSAST
jgi:hypothetical protein